jgi:hypothetical protein
MADPEGAPAPLHGDSDDEFASPLELAPAPARLEVTQPVAVYLQWLLIGLFAGSYALQYPVGALRKILEDAFPSWSQVAGLGAAGAFLLALIERSKRDRKAVGYGFGLLATLFALAAIDRDLLASYSAQAGASAVVAGFLCSALHLLYFEDWVAGRDGPRFRHVAATLRDLATTRWWCWFSKVALAQRARNRHWQGELRERRARAEAARDYAELQAARAEAERKTAENDLVAAQAAEAASRTERVAAADEAKRKAAEAQELRAQAELRVRTARNEIEELNRQAEAAALDRTRLRVEQMEAERRFLEAAMAAKAAAEKAVERGVEAARAQDLLERVQAEVFEGVPNGEASRLSLP